MIEYREREREIKFLPQTHSSGAGLLPLHHGDDEDDVGKI
jgi:hypothetical protein